MSKHTQKVDALLLSTINRYGDTDNRPSTKLKTV